MDYVQALLRKSQNNVLEKLQHEKQVQFEAFVFDGNTTSQLRKLSLNPAGSDRSIASIWPSSSPPRGKSPPWARSCTKSASSSARAGWRAW